ncbi:MAG: biotin--[acetyl-CoA-carboxylase] ligase [Candidatus Omnitrophota bacterium]
MDWIIQLKDKTTSVMDDLKGFPVPSSPDKGYVLLAAQQESGRGSLGRLWSSPIGGLYAGILLRPLLPARNISRMTLLSAVAVCEALNQQKKFKAKIKWPNDVLVDGKKIAGILIESETSGSTVEKIIIGIGINVNTVIRDLPGNAVSLKHLTGVEYNLEDFLNSILKRFEFLYEDAVKNDFDEVFNRWRQLSCHPEMNIDLH